MRKRSRKMVSILLTLAFLAAMLLPAGTAFAGDPVTFYNVAGLVDRDASITQNMGFVKMTNFSAADEIYIDVQLPTGVKFSEGDNVKSVATVVYSTDGSTTANAAIVSGDEDSLTIKVPAKMTGEDAYIKVLFNTTYKTGVKVDSSAADVINANFKVRGVESGTKIWEIAKDLVVAKVGKKKVTATAATAKTVKIGEQDQAIADITITESAKSAILGGKMVVTLDNSDFSWGTDVKNTTTAADIAKVVSQGSYGLTVTEIKKVDNQTAEFYFSTTSKSSPFGDEIKLKLKINVDPDAKDGDVVVKLESADVSDANKFNAEFDAVDLVVAKVGAAGATISVSDSSSDTIYQATFGKKIDTIKAESTGTFEDGAKMTLTLSKGVKWYIADLTAEVGSQTGVKSVVGTYNDGSSLWIKTKAESKVELKDLKVAVLPDAPVGDIKVTVEVAGANEEVVVGQVLAPATVTAEKANILGGKINQLAGKITITETKKDSMKSSGYLYFDLPSGVEWYDKPVVYVNGKKKELSTSAIQTNNKDQFKLESSDLGLSDSKIDVIELTEVKYTLDTRVTSGDITVKIGGRALNKLNGAGDTVVEDLEKDYATDSDNVLAVVNATAGSATKRDAALVIGSTAMKVNGAAVTMDVAPYIKDGRTYLPLRYVANALGVADANILWDAATQKVTLIKGTTIVQLTIGSKILMVNGLSLTMDVAPEITSDRTCLPIRFVAQVLGATVGWDEATQTVTMNIE